MNDAFFTIEKIGKTTWKTCKQLIKQHFSIPVLFLPKWIFSFGIGTPCFARLKIICTSRTYELVHAMPKSFTINEPDFRIAFPINLTV